MMRVVSKVYDPNAVCQASKAQAQDLMDRGQGSMTPAELLNGSLLDGEIIQMNGNALPFSSCEFFHFE